MAWNMQHVLPRSKWEYAARKFCKVNQTQWPENLDSFSSHQARQNFANETYFARNFQNAKDKVRLLLSCRLQQDTDVDAKIQAMYMYILRTASTSL